MESEELNGSFIEMQNSKYSNQSGNKSIKVNDSFDKNWRVNDYDNEKNKSVNLSYAGDDDYISFAEAFFILFRLSIPASLGSVLRRGIDIASYIFVGRLDDYNSTSGAGLSLISGNLL